MVGVVACGCDLAECPGPMSTELLLCPSPPLLPAPNSCAICAAGACATSAFAEILPLPLPPLPPL